MSSISFPQHFPYQKPRDPQKDLLQELSNVWDKYDVFIISAPTAFGKSAIAKTLMNSLRSVSLVTPTNQLVNQFTEEFSDTPVLHRMDSYWCEKWDRPCPVTRSKLLQFCSEKRDGCKCQASSDLSTAKYRRGPGVYNYYTYLSHKLYRDVLVVDEAHNLLSTIRDRLALTVWQHEYKYPANCYTADQIRTWIDTLAPNKRKNKKIQLLRESVSYSAPSHMFMRTKELFNGKGTTRGHPEERDCIRLVPVDVSHAPPMFWPIEVKKIVLMSATIGPKDVEQLGLDHKRIVYLDCASPIPVENRPIYPLDTVSVSRGNMDEALPIIAREIEAIADYHVGEKGLVHVTYQMSLQLQSALTRGAGGDRFLFHERHNKRQVYEEFRNSPAAEGKILVASGLYEGVDLPYDAGRWQVIAKIPWASLGNPAVKWQSENDPEGYLWDVIKITIQACGRICRTPTDFGITYILDKSFKRMYTQGRHTIPDWYSGAIQWRE